MKKLLLIALLLSSIFAEAQTPSPLYIPNNPDSIIHIVNVNGVQRRVYNIDLLKMQANKLATEQRVVQMISDSLATYNLTGYTKTQVDSITAKLRTEITAIVIPDISGKANNSNTVGVNGNIQNLGSNPNFTTDSLTRFQVTSPLSTVPNSIPAQALGYGTIPTTGTDIALTSIYILNLAHQTRIRQTGILTTIQVYIYLKPSTTLNFVIWRKTGGIYNIINSQSIISLVTASTTNLITLTTPISVQEGDYTGFSFTTSPSNAVFKAASLTGGMKYFTSDPGSSSDFSAATALAYYIPVNGFVIKSPVIASIGNSIIEGQPLNNSFISSLFLDSTKSTIPYFLDSMLNVTGQNLGIGGQTTTQILARFSSDLISLHPRYALIEGGVNDIYAAATTASVISNWTAMLQKCKDSSITPIIMLITPWTNGTNLQNMQIDTINSTLKSLAPSYNGIVADARSAIGQFRSGGTAGNLWDQQTIYAAGDGIHWNPLGYRTIATVIYNAFKGVVSKSFVIDSLGNGSINQPFTSVQYRLSRLNTAPASSTDTGTLGEIRITSTYIYICTATNTWVRSALTTF